MSLLDTASLIVTPNGYKEGKLYSVIPSDGSGDLSVTRATTATRVNSAGLVELVPYNLLEYSEQFDNAYWTKSSTTITANTTISPNGLQDADTAVFSSNGQIYRAISSNAVNTFSTYVKKGTNRYFSIQLETNSVVYRAIYDLDTTSVTFTGTNTSASITDEGNSWFRVSVVNTTSDAIAYTTLQAASSGTSVSGGSGTFYIWGAQLVEGSVAKDYQKTETRLNIPRLDYSNGTCPSILVEPQRTNLLTYSSSFSNAVWNALNCTITVNNVVSPSGIQNADTAVTTANNSFLGRAVSISSDGSTYTQSVFAKWVSGYELFKFRTALTGGTAVVKESVFNLKTGAYISGDTTYKIEDYGNGWFRFSHQITNNSTNTTYNYQIFNTNDSTQTQSASFWGAQLELGSYQTSYIPTTSASVTRNADVISKTGISSLIGQTEGTLFLDAFFGTGYDSNNMLMTLSDGGTNNIIYINRSNGGAEFYTAVSGATQAVYSGSILSDGVHKIAVAYKQNDFAMYVDGVQVFTDTSGNIPACDKLNIGSYANGGLPYNDGIKAAALWKTRLTNDELAQLTTI